MGVVYRAVDEQLHRPAAVKFLPESGPIGPNRLARFKNEARALAALNHPHILTIYEVGESEDVPFIASELVDGVTLRDRLRNGPMAAAEAIEIGIQIARALGAAHRKGIVHRDIKPENVMIRSDGYVKVLDFGLAELCAPAAPDGSIMTDGAFETVAATAAGTPAYMSPEQIESGPIDARSDVFSLAVTLCEAMTGANPFARATTLETVSAIGRTPGPAANTTTGLPARTRTLLLRALQKDPADRYQTTEEFISALEQAKEAVAGRAAWRIPRTALIAIVVTAAVILAGVAGPSGECGVPSGRAPRRSRRSRNSGGRRRQPRPSRSCATPRSICRTIRSLHASSRPRPAPCQ
jgi:serine/threonine protein kinase